MYNVKELLDLEMDMVRVLFDPNYINVDDEDMEDYYEDEDEEWGNTF